MKNIHRGSVFFKKRNSSSYIRKGVNTPFCSRTYLKQAKSSNSKRFSTIIRFYGFMHRTYSECKTLYETNSVTPSLLLETAKHLKGHLRWWLNIENLIMGRSITLWETLIIVTTDASKSGYGGHINNSLIVQGSWSVEEKFLHINSLEMKAVCLTVKHFLPKLIGKNVLIRSDNATVVRYVNKHGGTRSPQICIRTWKLLQLALENQIFLKAAHIAGKKNIPADH
ncbi:unnamed protein product [Mytilus coruscus]|uniref:Reverse transcriptase RNase H-like domain-containing protein n=1 Tax=Mytilus coruscus TaxID=42192 RepID=A0A6J8ERR4_MYTCO|nr:unnamed protein product [Mytilus coruscus]